MKKKKVAIIGGGIAGLYAAWRLRARRKDLDITVYEADGRVGGRICTTQFGITERVDVVANDSDRLEVTAINAELGAMRFPHEHKLLLNLCERLGIKDVNKESKPVAWRGPFQLQSLFHLRGVTLREESFHRREIPYRLRPEEGGKTPADLLEYAIFSMLEKMIDDDAKMADVSDDARAKFVFLNEFRLRLIGHEILSACDWMTFVNYDYQFAGIPLRNIGFWNVLKHFLSSEAFLLVHDGFGFLSVISNWNAPEAFKWLLTDFSPHQRLLTVPGGLTQIIERLEAELDGSVEIEKGRTLRDIHWEREADNFLLGFDEEDVADVSADCVILAMPPSALRRVRLFDGKHEVRQEVERDWKKLIQCSRPHRLAKIVLAYEEPWWQHTNVPGAESGRLFTDLPMRQIYYFGPRWLRENKWIKKTSGLSLVMVYNDSHYEAFWRTFHVHDKIYGVQGRIETTLGFRPEDIQKGSFGFWGPDKMKELLALGPNPTDEQMKGIDLETKVDEYEVRHRMEEKVREQLTELHGYEVPMAIGGVYRDWSVDGGWHTWEPFVDVPAVKDVILQPFCDSQDGIRIRPCGTTIEEAGILPLHICGEAYAWEQGWIEGALMTAERVAAVVSGSHDHCEKPEWFSEKQDAFDKYMYAELSTKRRGEVDTSEKQKGSN